MTNDWCKHEKHSPEYDPEKTRGMPSSAVRKLYPRFQGKCVDCGALVIMYASFEHYLSGDW